MLGSAIPIRGLTALSLVFAVSVAGCGGSSVVPSPSGSSGISASPRSSAGDNPLAPGLSAGLGKLDSYQFSWTLSSASADGTAALGTLPSVSGTVVNKATTSYRINDQGMVQFVVVGDRAWTSVDKGKTWTMTDLSSVDALNLMVDGGYATWFDKNAGGFKAAGEEPKNGIPCVHYKGDSSLTGLYSSISGTSAQFTADVWIAKDGGYPVSGAFGYSGPVGSKAGGFGFSFDVTHVNDPANSVAAPTNVLVAPTDAPAAT
jgi:hypothetical protein